MIRSFPLSDTATFMQNKFPSLLIRAAKLRLGPGFDGPNMCHAWAFLDRGCDSYLVDAGFKDWLALLSRSQSALICRLPVSLPLCKGDARNVQHSTSRQVFKPPKPSHYFQLQVCTLQARDADTPSGTISVRLELNYEVLSYPISHRSRSLVLHTSTNPWTTSEPQPQCQG